MSFGSAIGALVSLKNNRRDSKRKPGILPGGSSGPGVNSHRTPSKEELQQLRQKLQAEHQKRQLKIIGISAAVFIIFASLFFYVMF